MHKLLVLAADSAGGTAASTVLLALSEHLTVRYVFVGKIEGLLHYRHEQVPEAEARRLIHYPDTRTPGAMHVLATPRSGP